VSTLDKKEFLSRADSSCQPPGHSPHLPSPIIPHGYDWVAQWQMRQYPLKRETLAKCASLMSLMASRHPAALMKKYVVEIQL
jgi:hypothetical protein